MAAIVGRIPIMPTIAVTLLGIMFVLVMVTSQNNQLAAEENAGGDENEF